MDEIKHQVFMGNGKMSMAECYYLHQQLEKAFEELSGLQQMHMGRAEQEAPNLEELEGMREEAKHNIERIAKEIYVALTGEKVKKTKKVKEK